MLYPEKKRPLWRNWLWVDLIGGILLFAAVLLISVVGYGLRYPKLYISHLVWQNVLLLILLLAPVLGVIGLAAGETGKLQRFRFCQRLALPFFAAAVISAVVLCAMPPFCSSVSDPARYLQMDSMEPEAEEALLEIFPEKIPEQAKDVTYRYFRYASFPGESVYLTLGITLEEAEFEEELDRILALPQFAESVVELEEALVLLDAAWDAATDIKIQLHVTVDRTYRRLIYTVNSQNLRG